MKPLVAAIAVFLFLSQSSDAAADGPMASWEFNAGKRDVVASAGAESYHAKIVGATWERLDGENVLRFDGVDDYVQVSKPLNDRIRDAGTLVISYRPSALAGGLVGWSSGIKWTDQRLAISYVTVGMPSLFALVADGKDYQHLELSKGGEAGQWTQCVLTFDRNEIKVFQDGIRVARTARRIAPEISGLPLWIGRSQGLGTEYFNGIIENVHVYDRALSDGEIIATYKSFARDKGKDLTSFEQITIDSQMMTEPGWVILKANYGGLRPLSPGSIIVGEVRGENGTDIRAKAEHVVDEGDSELTMKIDVGDLPAGSYEVVAGVLAPGETSMKGASREQLNWPGRAEAFRGIRALNNLVWELLRVTDTHVTDDVDFPFTSPKKRWIHVSCQADLADGAELELFLKSASGLKKILTVVGGTNSPTETMRAADIGSYAIVLKSTGEANVRELSVRSIPELIYSEYQSQPGVAKSGPFDAAFLERHVLPNVNTLICGRKHVDDPFIPIWNNRGGKWLVHALVPGIEGIPGVHENPETKNVDETLGFLIDTVGIKDPRFGGTIADEFGDSQPHCALYAEALKKLQHTEYNGKSFYPYANAIYTDEPGLKLTKAIVETGNAIAVKNYLPTNPDETAARQYLQNILIDRTRKYGEHVPGSVEHLIMCLGYFSAPPEFLNVSPTVNYKTWLDMQFNAVANDPVFWGTYGLMTYLAGYADEETVRWAAHLHRRYGIEGLTAFATEDPYLLPHIQNPDFAAGADGWQITAAEEGSVRADRYADLGWLQGRYPRTTEGDTCLVLRRSSSRPNVVSQQIRDLEPGRLYSLRLILSDFKDMSQKQQHAMAVDIDGAEVMADKSFVELVGSTYTHEVGPYSYDHPAWMNYHWTIFRATSPTATLTIQDWESSSTPGGPVGQELLVNFAHVTPYFSHDPSQLGKKNASE